MGVATECLTLAPLFPECPGTSGSPRLPAAVPHVLGSSTLEATPASVLAIDLGILFLTGLYVGDRCSLPWLRPHTDIPAAKKDADPHALSNADINHGLRT
jgi:hypothetical protein